MQGHGTGKPLSGAALRVPSDQVNMPPSCACSSDGAAPEAGSARSTCRPSGNSASAATGMVNFKRAAANCVSMRSWQIATYDSCLMEINDWPKSQERRPDSWKRRQAHVAAIAPKAEACFSASQHRA